MASQATDTPDVWHRAGSHLRSVVILSLIAVLGAACGSSVAATSRARVPHRGSSSIQSSPGAPDRSCLDAAGGSEALDVDRSKSSGVSEVTLTLIDPTRPTLAIPARPARPCRVLPTVVRYPTRMVGPVPLIVVAHGLDGSPRSLALLLDAWAGAGYVVAAPTFPTTQKDRQGSSLPTEPVDQAADMSFVIDQLLVRSRPNVAGPLAGMIDSGQIGAAGMSLGGLGVYGMISNTCCRDPRVRAAILMAAVRRQFPNEKYEANVAPVLLVQGDADTGYHNSRDAYPELAPPKWFITLHGSEHSPPFEVPPGPEAPLVYTTTALFWDRYLKNDATADPRIAAAVRGSHGEATLQRDLGH